MTRDTVTPPQRTRRLQQGEKLRSADKVERIPVKVIPTVDVQRKPEWMRIRLSSSPKVQTIKNILRKHKMATVCEEAACPNLHECFSNGTATFMIMGEICTRRCPFCDVGHGKPNPLDTEEPKNLALAIHEMALNYVVITSVDRDDLRDGGAQHFADCIREAKLLSPDLQVEVLCLIFAVVWPRLSRFLRRRRRMSSTTIWKLFRASTAKHAQGPTTSGRLSC